MKKSQATDILIPRFVAFFEWFNYDFKYELRYYLS